MKILLITAYFYPEQFKSTDLAYSLKEIGHEVSVLTGIPNYPQGKIYEGYSNITHTGYSKLNGINIYRAFTLPRGKNSFSLFLNYFSILLSFSFFSIFLRFKSFEKVIFIGFSPGLLAFVNIFFKRLFHKNPQSTLWLQDFWPDDLISTGFFKDNSWFINLNHKIMKLVYKTYDRLMATSEGMKAELEKRTEGQVTRVFNPVEKDLFNLMINTKKPVLKKAEKIKIMFVGNVSGNQNIENVLKAFESETIREKAEIHFYTHGTRKVDLVKTYSDFYSQSIKIMGSLAIKDLFFASHDYDFGLVSLSDFENLKHILPSRVQTLVSMGLPLLSFGSLETSNLISIFENGIAVDKCDFISFQKGISKASATSSEERLNFSKNSIRLANDLFSPNLIAQSFT